MIDRSLAVAHHVFAVDDRRLVSRVDDAMMQVRKPINDIVNLNIGEDEVDRRYDR